MNEHVHKWLQAYHDEQLGASRRRIVETHLTQCAYCRAELAELQNLSALLQTAPEPQTAIAPERFASQVSLRMARQPEQTPWEKAFNILWQAVPLVLAGVWAFLQVAFVVGNLLLISLDYGLLGSAGDFLFPVRAEVPGLTILLDLLLSFLIGLFYASWLASWWVRRQSAQTGQPNGEQTISAVQS